MHIEFNLQKRGSIAGGTIETIWRTSISSSETENLDKLERFFRQVLEEHCGFIAQTARSGEATAYKIWVLYDVKEDCYLLALQENTRCLHRLKTAFSVDV